MYKIVQGWVVGREGWARFKVDHRFFLPDDGTSVLLLFFDDADDDAADAEETPHEGVVVVAEAADGSRLEFFCRGKECGVFVCVCVRSVLFADLLCSLLRLLLLWWLRQLARSVRFDSTAADRISY